MTIADVVAALTALAKRAGSGSVQGKIDALVALLRRASPLEARYLLRIPMGRLRLGVGDATIMDGLALARGDRTLRATIERAYNLCSDLGLVARTLFTEGGARALARFRVEVGRPVKMQFAERASSIDDNKKTDRFRTIAKVAAGMSEADWIALRKRLEKDRILRPAARLDTRIEAPYWVEPRIVVEVFADEITRSPVHTAGAGRDDGTTGLALRFPRIVRGVRQDRSAEDATTEAEIERLYALQRRGRGRRAAARR